MQAVEPTRSARWIRRISAALCLAAGTVCGAATIHAWTLDDTVRVAGGWVEALRAERLREAVLQEATSWLRSHACGGQTGELGRLCKRETRPILERELSSEWFARQSRRAHDALVGFLDDGRDRVIADIGAPRKNVRQALWALWTKAGGWDARQAGPFLPAPDPGEFHEMVASSTRGVPDRVTLGWLAVARGTPAGLRHEIGDDYPPDAAARSPEGRALRSGWSWLQRLKWGLPAALILFGAVLLARTPGLPRRLFTAGALVAAGAALYLATLPVLGRLARDGLDRALPVGSPGPEAEPRDGVGPAGRWVMSIRGERQVTASITTVVHGVGVRLVEATWSAGRTVAWVALLAGGALALALLPVAWRWRWLRRGRRRVDSLPPVIGPPGEGTGEEGACRMHGAMGLLLLLAVAGQLAGCSSERARRRVPAGANDSCAAEALDLHERIELVQNTLTMAGFGQAGPVSRVRLAEGGPIELPIAVRPGYRHLIFAIGDGGIPEIAAEIVGADGTTLARDAGYGPVAAIRYLSGGATSLTVRLRAEGGAGAVALLVWGRAGIESPGVPGGGEAASCGQPVDLEPGGTVQGSTVGAFDGLMPTCASGDAPEHVYRIVLAERSVLRAEAVAAFDVVLSLMTACDNDPAATVRCSDRRGSSVIAEALPAGTYYLVVDGTERAAGSYRLSTSVRRVAPLGEVCAELPALIPGEVATGTTVGRWNDFRTDGTCAGGSSGPDVAYRLELDRPARVRLDLEASYDGALSLRSTCDDPSSVIACNDDAEDDSRRSRIGRRLAAGSYTVVVDGLGDERGEYRLAAVVVPDGEGFPEVANDRCVDATPLAEGATLDADLLFARDDGTGSCAAAPGGGDVFARLDLERPTVVDALVLDPGDPPPTLYLWRACGGPEVACGEGRVTGELPAGPAWLVVDAPPAGGDDAIRVVWSGWDPAREAALCDDAPQLEIGRLVTGRTEGKGFVQGSCATSPDGPEAAYRLTLATAAHVTLDLKASFDCVLYVRTACAAADTELGCNDDGDETTDSRLDLDLDAGSYWVIVDSYAEDGGDYELVAAVRP